MDQRRDVRGIGVAVASETLAFRRLEDGGLKDPSRVSRFTGPRDWMGMDPEAMPSLGKFEKAGMVHIPSAIDG
jgi:hypothetical protein